MVFILFLISVGVLELILWRDRKKTGGASEAPGRQTAKDLLQLLRALESERPAPLEQRIEAPKKTPEYNRRNVG